MKPKILILIHYLELGGAEMALMGLLSTLDPAKVDVDLFVYSHRGPLMQYIPSWVKLLPRVKAYSMIEQPIGEAIKARQFGVVAGRILAKLRHRLYRRKIGPVSDDGSEVQFVADSVTPVLPRINPGTCYDLCISFLTPHNFGLKKVNARKRLAWIHTDYSTVHFNTAAEQPIWSGYDAIASISDSVRQSFISAFPALESRIVDIENMLPVDYILSRADEADVSNEFTGTVNLLSIGRYCNAKNYDNLPDICRRLRLRGVDVKWYIIGYGGDEALIKSKIAETGMSDYVILLGKKANPYPYIKACDIYVQPSRYEGKSITVREAQILGKPVAVTNYPTAKSQILHGTDGVIVPLDNEGCAAALADFIIDKNLQSRLTANLKATDWQSRTDIDKIYNLLTSQ